VDGRFVNEFHVRGVGLTAGTKTGAVAGADVDGRFVNEFHLTGLARASAALFRRFCDSGSSGLASDPEQISPDKSRFLLLSAPKKNPTGKHRLGLCSLSPGV
jgi:hypothetical protein